VKRKGGYLPIAGYAAIGDGRTTALVGADGAIDFLSLPSIHCPTTFGALLDAKKGGSFVLRPSKRFDAERRYLERTNVLETTYTTKSGVVRVTEALTLQNGGLLPWVEVARRVEGLSGDVPMEWRVEPRFDWGRVEPTITRRRGATIAQGEDLHLGIHSFDAGDSLVGEGSIFGSFAARAGSRALLAVCCSTERQPIAIPTRDEVERRLDATTESWRRWLGGWRYDGPWADHVARSALALKLLVYAPRGSIVAAPTTSLPERIGGDRNYDYRYMWVRDTSFSLEALMRLGLPEQVQESFSCLLRSVRTTVPEIHPFYSVEGEPAHRSDVLEHLDGYRGSAPVQHGNAASRQLQLGSWGDLLETTDLYVESGNALDDDTGELLADCVDRLAVVWPDEDSGIWELHDHRHYTCSKIASWMAFDRALKLSDAGELPSVHADRWREERDAIERFVEEKAWSDELQSYVEYPRTKNLDAALLRGARNGWPRVSPERFDSTLEVTRERLDAGGGLLYRTTRTMHEEGAFVACSFWLVEALSRCGRVDDAAKVFEQVVAYENDVGLLSEEIDPASGEFLGNFPQGLSHLALINAAGAIQDARGAGASATADAAAR
jgi:GH15 family glucan-1,4-alpha-glucosidase